jgi:hypothetical protein
MSLRAQRPAAGENIVTYAPLPPARILLRYGAAALTLFFILMAAGCGGDSSSSPSPQPAPAPGGSFAPVTSTPTMNNGRVNATATLLANGKVLIAGGQGIFGPTSSVELYAQ